MLLWMTLVVTFFIPNFCWAGAQQQEALSDSVRAGLHHAVSDVAAPEFLNAVEGQHWLRTILRHYLDIEHGNLNRALDRYNGSLNQQNYANSVIFAWHNNWAHR